MPTPGYNGDATCPPIGSASSGKSSTRRVRRRYSARSTVPGAIPISTDESSPEDTTETIGSGTVCRLLVSIVTFHPDPPGSPT